MRSFAKRGSLAHIGYPITSSAVAALVDAIASEFYQRN
jgi:hypothetical protein